MTLFSSRFFWLFLFFATVCQAQTDVYFQPEISVNHSPKNRWSFNFQLANRNLVIKDGAHFLEAQQLEFSHFTSYESGFYSKVSLGVMYRNKDWFNPENSDEYRVTEQYSFAKKYNALRLSHRLRTEQRYYTGNTVYRGRYRFAADFPLQGASLNHKEFYGSLSAEVLYSLSAKMSPELDQRFTTTLGKQITEQLKLQLGLEYRFENYLNEKSERILISTSAIYKI